MHMPFVRISAMAIQIGDKPAADGLRVVNSSHVVVGRHAPVGKDGGQVECLDDGQSISHNHDDGFGTSELFSV